MRSFKFALFWTWWLLLPLSDDCKMLKEGIVFGRSSSALGCICALSSSIFTKKHAHAFTSVHAQMCSLFDGCTRRWELSVSNTAWIPAANPSHDCSTTAGIFIVLYINVNMPSNKTVSIILKWKQLKQPGPFLDLWPTSATFQFLGNQQNLNAKLCWDMPISRNVWQLKGDSWSAAVCAIQHVRACVATSAATHGIWIFLSSGIAYHSLHQHWKFKTAS